MLISVILFVFLYSDIDLIYTIMEADKQEEEVKPEEKVQNEDEKTKKNVAHPGKVNMLNRFLEEKKKK